MANIANNPAFFAPSRRGWNMDDIQDGIISKLSMVM